MLENYAIGDLLIGKLVTVTQGWHFGPHTAYEGPYIFYNTNDNKYAEIFTETEYSYNRPSVATTRKSYKLSNNIETNEFGKTYIEQTESIVDYLTEEEKDMLTKNPNTTISKKRVVEIYKNMIIKNAEHDKLIEQTEKQYTLNRLK